MASDGFGPKAQTHPVGWHPPMAAPSDLKKNMSYKDYSSFLQRESKILAESVNMTDGPINREPWKYLPEFTTTTISNSSIDSHIRFQRSIPIDSTFAAWDIEPLPLSKKEERQIIKRRRWCPLKSLRFGQYKVSPTRYDLQWIQRIYWTAREIRSFTRMISCWPSKVFIKDLKAVRNLIYSLSSGNGVETKLQRSLLSDVYFCLRQCSRLQDDEESLSETRATVVYPRNTMPILPEGNNL
jgi:hypothetical protein